jgi:hypothetical protein
MPLAFERTPLWQRTLAACTDDPYTTPREALRYGYFRFRATVEPLAGEIARSMPMFTDHSIVHADSLWDTASQVCGPDFPLNPAEAFVLGGAFLLHDLGMGLASYSGGVADLEADPQFDDVLASMAARLRRSEPSTPADTIERAAREATVVELLRLRHAVQGQRLMTLPFRTSDGEPFFLLQDAELRHSFGSLIGQLAHSHWLDVADLKKFGQPVGSCVDLPPEWELDPLKIACVLRLADAAHIDHRRAPTLLHAFRRPTGVSRDHWYFQERLTRPRVVADRFEYTASRPFGRTEAGAWWLAYDTIQCIDQELRRVDALCADLGRPRFAVRSVAGADSPERLASYLRTEGWEPIDARLRVSDATQLIANLGGKDLYGLKPDIAIRELVANAADATRARRIHDGVSGTVTIRLRQDGDSWWLSVEDHGIGMAPPTMVAALTDFGRSRWQDPETISGFPGLLAKGFVPTGRFGIGFFAVFMVADEVQVISLAYDEAPRSTHILEFQRGVTSRPLLRQADPHERLKSCGTVVQAKLRIDPRTIDGLFKTTNRRLSHTELLHSRVIRMCALADVDIAVQGPDDKRPARVIQAGDWTRIPAAELFRRLYRRDEASQHDRLIYDGYEKLFIDHAQEVRDASGEAIGRAMLVSGLESVHPDLRWMRPPEGLIYVGGLHASTLYYCMGAFCGEPLTADRLKAFPVASLAEFQQWVEAQADAIRDSPWSTPFDLDQANFIARGLGATAPRLPCALSADGPLDRGQLVEWLTARDEVLLMSYGSLFFLVRESGRPLVMTFHGDAVILPDNGILVGLHPPWLFEEEVLPRPRDERFADAVEPPIGWDARTWWYDTGNCGAIGLVVRTVADVWGLNIEETIALMEPLDLRADEDLRVVLPTSDGDAVRVTTIRLRRPERARSGTASTIRY